MTSPSIVLLRTSRTSAEDCGTDALVPGTKVLEAELKVRRGAAVWTEVELFAKA